MQDARTVKYCQHPVQRRNHLGWCQRKATTYVAPRQGDAQGRYLCTAHLRRGRFAPWPWDFRRPLTAAERGEA